MKKNRISFVAVFISIFLCVPIVWSMNHEKQHEHDPHNMKTPAMGHDQHSGMVMGESMIILGQDKAEGVVGMAHLSDAEKQMAALGRAETHHFMIMFSDGKTGQALDKGVAALKVRTPAGKTSSAVKMIAMEGHFGADIILEEKGEYQFLVGTKLADGVQRQFQFTHVLE